MTAQQTETTTTTQQQPTHHFILTLQTQNQPNSLHLSTFNNAITPPTGWTRQQVYKALYDEITRDNPHLAHAQTMFFALEPNQL